MTSFGTIIVGTGVAGIAAAAHLARRGITDVVLLERAGDVGGTWRDNTYPGVGCDIPSHLYAFSFRPNPGWTRRFSSGSEIQSYLHETARAEGLLSRIRFDTDVLDMTWDEHTSRWSLATSRGGFTCRSLIIATGRLSEPVRPDLPGLETFPGTVMHTSEWDPATRMTGARVGIAGTGASAVQLIPHLVTTGSIVTVFQRSAPYVVPRDDAPITKSARAIYDADPAALALHRIALFDEAEAGHTARITAGPERDALLARALGHLATQVTDPQLRRDLTPDYEIGCKRILLSDDYYPALIDPTVTLEPSAIVALDGEEAVAASGNRHRLDTLVLATGFAATRPPVANRIHGRGGRSLAEHWADGMTAYASILISGFPNLFVIDGPNAALGHNSAIPMIEAQARLIADFVGRLFDEPSTVVEASIDQEREWTARLDDAGSGSVWLSGCASWYVDDASGRLTLLWPGTTGEFEAALRAVDTRSSVLARSVAA